MNTDELNEFIARYAIEYKTKTAVLLTGDWGSGKSHYINHALRPYLKRKGVKCIVVSLYGIDSLSELSKQIYLQLRFPTFSKKSEVKESLAYIGQSIINSTLAINGLTLSSSEKQLKKLYESVSLKDILLVIEDFERSNIDILKLLGFINGLVEYDGAKVLLVANENEIRDNIYISSTCSNTNCDNSETPESQIQFQSQYRKIKEKTIGDTIQFKADVVESVTSILSDYSGNWINKLADQVEICRISNMLLTTCKSNFRLLKYALQKYNDIFSNISEKHSFDDSFYHVAFEGALLASSRFLSSDIPAWEGTQYLSTSLGSAESPLFRFVYEYLRWNTLELDEVLETYKEYKNYCYFEKNATRENDEDLFIIREYHIQPEKNVIAALKNIETKLINPDFIGIHAYEELGYQVINAGNIVGYNTDNICSELIMNAKSMCKKQHLSAADIIWRIFGGESDSEEVKTKYSKFISELANAIEEQDELTDFSYNPEDIYAYYLNSCKNRYQYIRQHKFIGRLNPEKLYSMLTKCTSKQINDFRGLLFVYYRNAIRNEYDEADVKVLKQLLMLLDRKANKTWDRIQLLQIGFLKSNLQEFIESME